ncbi:MAG: ParB/RepB/Spo0J family partition protein [Patescibacteria group bacterium]|nr:ParB/RepB/Spo0J family partition protein [Patescibacteria group bacterium]
MIDAKPTLEFIPLKKLELWEEANVRKSDVLLNIGELAGSIKRNGLRMPLLVKEVDPKNKYLVFSGQRRLAASQIANIAEAPCFVFKNISLTDARILSFSENQFRESMTIDDKSNAANELYKKFKDIDRVALALGVKPPTVRTYLKYNAVPEELKAFAGKGQGKLSTSEIEDIYVKFPDLKRALAVAKKLSSIKERHKRRKYHAAVRDSTPSDDVETVTHRAEKLIHMKEFEILLPDSKYKTIEKVAYTRKIKPEDLLVDIVEKWIDEYDGGLHR